MNGRTGELQDSRLETTTARRSVMMGTTPRKAGITKDGGQAVLVLKARYLQENEGGSKVVVDLERNSFAQSLLVRKINRSIKGSDLDDGENRSDVYSVD